MATGLVADGRRAESHDSREAFWSSLLDRAKLRTRLHSGVSATTDPWLRAGSGRSGIHWTYAIQKRNAGVQLVIEGPDAGQNHALFGALERERDEIEKAFGDSLDWDRVEGRKRCTIGKALPGGYQEDRERWPEIQDDMVEAMIRLEAAIKPQLERVSL